MKQKIDGFIRLIRIKEYLFFVSITTLMGASAGYGIFGWRLIGVLFANLLAVAFAFMINDVEDAPEDSLNPEKVLRNPVSAKHITRREAMIATWVTGGLSAVTFSLLGFWPFVMGMTTLVVGFLYSWRRLRLKNLPFIDMLSHCMMLAGLQYLAAYLAYQPAPFTRWFFPMMMVVCISLYGELFNEMRDYEHDLKAGLKHTAALLGFKATYWLMMSSFAIGVISGGITFFVVKLVATWVLILMAVFAGLLLIAPLLKAWRQKGFLQLQESLQKPFEIAASFALLTQFVLPWAMQRMF
jgi:4-hydroxybenzoate polyprenyltransferase